MWVTYTYEIAVSTSHGGWQRLLHGEEVFSRAPQEVARSLLERWINDNRDNLLGGQVIICRRGLAADPTDLDTTVRVRVFRGTLTSRKGIPDAEIERAHV